MRNVINNLERKGELKIWKTSKSGTALTGCSHTPHSHRTEAWPGSSDLDRYQPARQLSTDRHSQSTSEMPPSQPYNFVLVLPLLLSPTLSKTCCSSPKPSQPILCSSRNSCILRGLGNTSGISTGNPESEKSFRDPRLRGGMPAYSGQ